MADITLKRKHHLGLKGARAAANKMVKKIDEKFGLSGDWEDNTLHFDRTGITGRLTVSETDLHLEVELGFLMKMMKGPLEASIHENLDKVLAEAKPEAAPKASAKKSTKK